LNTRSLGDVVEIGLGRQRIFVVNHPDLIRHIMVVDAKKFDKGSMFEKAATLLGNGLTTSSGAFHLQQRRRVQPPFHPLRMPGYGKVMVDIAKNAAESWQAGQRLAVDQEMHEIACTTTAKTLFSSDLSERAVAEMRRSLRVFLAQITRRTFSPFSWLEKVPT